MIDQAPAQLLPGLTQRVPELGRIRLGEKTDKGAPRRLTTFRLTSPSKSHLEAAAKLYGGHVKAWTGAPDEGQWELYTQAAELDVLIPAALPVVSQGYELWQGGTCERRCDGVTEQLSGAPCLCAADGLTGADRVCDIVTRLRVMLPRVPGLGVWRLDTSGYQAATTLPSTVQLLSALSPGRPWIPAVLRAEQRSKKERLENNKVETHRFVVPVLDLPGTTIGQVAQLDAPEALAQLESGEAKAPPTAAQRAAARRAELEAQPAQPVATSAPSEGCPVTSPRGEACTRIEGKGHAGDHKNGVKSWSDPVDVVAQAQQVFAGDVKTVGPDLSPRVDPDVDAGLGLLQPAGRR